MDCLVLQIKPYWNTCYLLTFGLCPFWPAVAALSSSIRDPVAHKAYPLQKKIAYSALDDYSTVVVEFPSPLTKDTSGISETNLFTSIITAYNKSFSYFTGEPARTLQTRLIIRPPPPESYSQSVIPCTSTSSFELHL